MGGRRIKVCAVLGSFVFLGFGAAEKESVPERISINLDTSRHGFGAESRASGTFFEFRFGGRALL